MAKRPGVTTDPGMIEKLVRVAVSARESENQTVALPCTRTRLASCVPPEAASQKRTLVALEESVIVAEVSKTPALSESVTIALVRCVPLQAESGPTGSHDSVSLRGGTSAKFTTTVPGVTVEPGITAEAVSPTVSAEASRNHTVALPCESTRLEIAVPPVAEFQKETFDFRLEREIVAEVSKIPALSISVTTRLCREPVHPEIGPAWLQSNLS